VREHLGFLFNHCIPCHWLVCLFTVIDSSAITNSGFIALNEALTKFYIQAGHIAALGELLDKNSYNEKLFDDSGDWMRKWFECFLHLPADLLELSKVAGIRQSPGMTPVESGDIP
jgi:hypothetical protein